MGSKHILHLYNSSKLILHTFPLHSPKTSFSSLKGRVIYAGGGKEANIEMDRRDSERSFG
jgi:hypothetical protein